MQKEKETKTLTQKSKILAKEWLTDNTFILKLERKRFAFRPGQYIVLLLNGESREYSISSGLEDDYIEIMIRLVPEGNLTPLLANMNEGDEVDIEGPYGFFLMRPEEMQDYHYYFIATGTGISPVLSFTSSYPQLNYTLIHGVREGIEAYRHHQIPENRRIICTSRDKKGTFNGRVTEYIKKHSIVDPNSVYYLCGNSAMIDEVTDFLESNDVDPFDIRQEVFF